jgi:phage-related protein
MLLHELGRDTWTVLAIARSETECELKEVLAQPDSNDLGARMLRFLVLALPASGPPKNEERSKQLDAGIYEFRMTPKRGPALRVLWMYDEGRRVVCIHGYWKTTQRTPPAEIEKARRSRSDYLLAKRGNLLEITCADWARAS